MTDNLVRLIVGTNDADATAHLEALKRRLQDFGRMIENAQVNVKGDAESKLKLDRLTLAADRLNNKVINMKVGDIGGIGRAMVQMDALGLAVDRLGRKVGDRRGGLIGAFQALDYAGLRAMESLGNAGTTFINPITIALGALAAIVSGPLIANLALITAGFGIFAAAAVPEITKVWKAVDQGGAALKKLDPAERALAGPIRSLQSEFDKLQKAVRPEILRAFGEGLRIIKDLMPALTPLAQAAGKALDGFLRHIDQWLRSSSGQKFLHWMEVDGPKAIATFGKDMWAVAQFVGRTFSFMRNAGETWWKNFQIIVHAVMTIWSNAARGFSQLGQHILFAYRSLVTGFTQAGHLLESVWDATWKAVTAALSAAWSVISGIFHAIEGAISSVSGAISGLMGSLGGLSGAIGSVSGFLGHLPFGLAAGGIVGAASGGPRGGLTLVGERGPELLRLPPGSQVFNSGQTQAMLGGGGQQQITVVLEVAPGSDQSIATALAHLIRIRGGSPEILTRKAKFA